MPALTSLNMGDNNIGDGCAEALASCLGHMPNLKSLLLNMVNFGDIGASTLVTVMQQLDSLTHLSFVGNRLTDAATNMLIDALKGPDGEIWV